MSGLIFCRICKCARLKNCAALARSKFPRPVHRQNDNTESFSAAEISSTVEQKESFYMVSFIPPANSRAGPE